MELKSEGCEFEPYLWQILLISRETLVKARSLCLSYERNWEKLHTAFPKNTIMGKALKWLFPLQRTWEKLYMT